MMTGFAVVAALALLTGPDDPVNDSPSPSQAASAVIAANARAQRDRRVARVLWERARSQSAPVDTFDVNADAGRPL